MERTIVVKVRASPAERERWREAAPAGKLSLLIRTAVDEHLKRKADPLAELLERYQT